MEVIHPTNDPSLVSYHRPELVTLLPGLELLRDCWTLLSPDGHGSAKKKYLPREVGERPKDYEARLARAVYPPTFRDSIKAYAGLLNRFQMIGVPPSLADNEQNVDRQGSSIYNFWNTLDALAIRDAGTYILIDMPPAPKGPTNYFDEQNDGRVPYLIAIERKDVINWFVDYVGGREILKQVTVRQIRSTKTSDGFGVNIEPVYRVFRPGSVETFRLVKVDNRWTNVSEGIVPTTLPVIPIIWYSSSNNRFAQGDLGMVSLAEFSIQHFQMRSDLIELLHKSSMPVPVRKGAPNAANGAPRPLLLGPNVAVDLPENGSFEFAEPTGRSLERHQAEITHVEGLMDRSSLNFLYGANIKTATEASLRASQISSQVSALVRNKVSCFTTMMKIWAAYSGETASINKESGISINDSLINRPIDPSGIAQMVNLYSSGLLSKRTVLDELQRGGVLDPDMKIDDEIARLNKEKAEADAEAEKQRAKMIPANPIDQAGADGNPKDPVNNPQGKEPGPPGSQQDRKLGVQTK